MKYLKVILPGVCLMAFLVAGCHKKGTTNDRVPTTHKVVIQGMKFHPAKLTVAKGDTVVWINKDLVTHNVTEYPDSDWTSGPITNGESWKKVINGSFKYFCSIHPTMKGRVIVKGGN